MIPGMFFKLCSIKGQACGWVCTSRPDVWSIFCIHTAELVADIAHGQLVLLPRPQVRIWIKNWPPTDHGPKDWVES